MPYFTVGCDISCRRRDELEGHWSSQSGVAATGLRAVLTRQQIACNCFGNLRGEILGWRQVALLPCWLALTATAQTHPPAWGPRQGLLGLAVLLAGLACARLPRELRLWHRLRGNRLAIEEGFRPPPRKLANETGVWLLAAAVLAVLLVVDTGAFGLRAPSWRRQTPKRLLYQLGSSRAAFLWGLDAGLVVTTFRVTSLSWAALTVTLLGLVPWWVGIAYALGFTVPLGMMMLAVPKRVDPTGATDLPHRRRAGRSLKRHDDERVAAAVARHTAHRADRPATPDLEQPAEAARRGPGHQPDD